ncbi:MAG TPA: HNH endonuclease signature motif containing protein [Gemmatimonadaceae bacterium]|nr:HNH endonuclease signature motif containing protein [Gemmatimonadaceae bacterium]
MPSRSRKKPGTHAAAAHGAAPHAASTPRTSSRPRSRARGTGESKLTSLPTGRAAYLETRRWLVEQHGLTCAYCAKQVAARSLTLDHVAPRRGMTAYDRRDNLVLCCLACNGLKADTTAMAWLLAKRMRAINLVRFGSHLSPQLVAMARDLAGPEGIALAAKLDDPDYPYAD